MPDLIFVQIDQILSNYFGFYNNERPHEALVYRTPHEVYFETEGTTGAGLRARGLTWTGMRRRS